MELGGESYSSLSSKILGKNGKAQNFEDNDSGARK